MARKKVGSYIREASKSKNVKRTARKFGKARAHKQMIAIGFSKMRRARRRK